MRGKRVITGMMAFQALLLVAQKPSYKDPKQSVEVRVKDLLGRMTPEEKFWQCFMIPGDLDQAAKGQYHHGIFGFQVSASNKGDGVAGQIL